MQHCRCPLERGAANSRCGTGEHSSEPLMVSSGIALVTLDNGREVHHSGDF